jgi:hypothetical protein
MHVLFLATCPGAKNKLLTFIINFDRGRIQYGIIENVYLLESNSTHKAAGDTNVK